MLHRGAHKKVAPNMWSICGGHVEPDEMNDPRMTALREMREETGVALKQLRSLSLRYVMMTAGGGELRVHHNFIGELLHGIDLPQCDEGTFHWLAPAEIPAKPMPPSMRAMMEHYTSNPCDPRVHMGVVTADPYGVNWTHQAPDAINP